MGQTKISWASHTINAGHGCSKPIETDPDTGKRFISPECVHCYAETLSLKRGWTSKAWTGPNAVQNVRLRPDRLREITALYRQAPKGSPSEPLLPSQRFRVFVDSMWDIFHEQVPDSHIAKCFDTFAACPEMIFQVLTKRPERAATWPGPWPPNIWMGTTCGHPATKHRIEYLRRTPAAVRFISAEPLLASLLPIDLAGIDQVIVGGESGPGYRPMDMQWARELRDACCAGGVGYFFKQDAAYQTELRCYLVEENGECWKWAQFPGELRPPERVEPDNARKHRDLFPILKERTSNA